MSLTFTVAGKKRHPLEADVQKDCWELLQNIHRKGRPLSDYSYMVPNGTQLAGGSNARRARYMASLKAQGFKTGVSDLVIAYPCGGHHGAYIELKREREVYGTPAAAIKAVSADQREWLRTMAGVGYWVYVAYGVDDFIKAVKMYLRGAKQPGMDFELKSPD